MGILSVRDLCKRCPSFELKDISFTMQSGTIVGFVGRNDAEKSATLKSMLNFVRPDAGGVEFFGLDFRNHELEIKERVSFTFGEVNFYPKKRIRDVTDVSRRFFRSWGETAYRYPLERFELVETKKLDELSQGMRVKYAMASSLSHRAELILLDEPTNSLDPVSRDDLLDVFRDVATENGASILFSTQIMTNLGKCADIITYIYKSRILASTTLGELAGAYRDVSGGSARTGDDVRGLLIGCRERGGRLKALIHAGSAPTTEADDLQVGAASLESTMIHLGRKWSPP